MFYFGCFVVAILVMSQLIHKLTLISDKFNPLLRHVSPSRDRKLLLLRRGTIIKV